MRKILFFVSATFLGLALLAALTASRLAPYPLGVHVLSEQLLPPSFTHWMGQNQNGEDLFTLILYGSRMSLLVGASVVLISLLFGSAIGIIAGYFGGRTDLLISRVIDMIMAFPGILLAIALSSVMGPSVVNVVAALSISGWVPFARLTRGQVLSLRSREYVQAARSLGASPIRIMWRHLLPNLGSLMIVQASFAFSAAILAESSLSYLGLGTPVGVPSWGKAISDGSRYLLRAPHLATFPGIAIMLSVLTLNYIGDYLRDLFHELGK